MAQTKQTPAYEAGTQSALTRGSPRSQSSADSALGQYYSVTVPLLAEKIEAAAISSRDGANGTMDVYNQLNYFAGCIYVRADNKVYVPDGGLLDRPRFNAMYCGFLFVLDREGKKTTSSAWRAFTQNRVYQAPQCHEVCSRPEEPIGVLINEDGRVLLNRYVPGTTFAFEGRRFG